MSFTEQHNVAVLPFLIVGQASIASARVDVRAQCNCAYTTTQRYLMALIRSECTMQRFVLRGYTSWREEVCNGVIRRHWAGSAIFGIGFCNFLR